MQTSGEADLGVLLVGHGTRDSEGLAEFAETARRFAARLAPVPVEASFLELAEPTIDAGLARLVERGVRRVVVTPVLLFAAGHAKQDIPAAVQAAAARHHGLRWRQSEPLGCHPALLQLSTDRFLQALEPGELHSGAGGAPGVGATADPTCQLIVVGRGSLDPEAIAETHRYAQALAESTGVVHVCVGFLAMAEPRLADCLAAAARSPYDLLVVQPHLLFHGELLGEVSRRVAEYRIREPAKRWRLAGHLGASEPVVTAVLDRCRSAAALLAP